jgi:hypothetical protein
MKHFIILLLITTFIYTIYAQSSNDEPYSTATAAGVTFNYRITPDLQNLECQMIGQTTGWVGVGFSPTNGMQNANFIIGYHQNGNTFVRDDWGTSPSSHASDVSLGGTSNIISSLGSEIAGLTQVNFIIPLNSGDNYDRVLTAGNSYTIILARGQNGTDNFTGSHSAAGSTQITLVQPVSNDDSYVLKPATSINLKLYPNPFSTEATIVPSVSNKMSAKIEIYNSKGKRLQTFYAKDAEQLIWDSSLVPSGVYFIKASNQEGSVTKKVLKL